MLIHPLGEVPSIPKLKCWWKKSADHLGCTNICKGWDKLPVVSGARFLLSTVFMRRFSLWVLSICKSTKVNPLGCCATPTHLASTLTSLKPSRTWNAAMGCDGWTFQTKMCMSFLSIFHHHVGLILSFGWCQYRKTLKPRPWGSWVKTVTMTGLSIQLVRQNSPQSNQSSFDIVDV